MIVRARAPVRIDFAGGWTDVPIFAKETPGVVVNAAINRYSYASIHHLPEGEGGIRLTSDDYDAFVEAESVRKLEYDGSIDLVKAAVRRMELGGGFEIVTRSSAPAGSGLGTSASMGVAILGALARLKNRHHLVWELAELASGIEKHELGILGGKQDHYASAAGGINCMFFSGEIVRTSPLRLSPATACELEKSLVLCYTGKSRLSGDIHERVTEAFRAGEAPTVGAVNDLKRIAHEVMQALLDGDFERFAELLDQNWECQKRLHPSVTNDQIEELFAAARGAGAAAGKACGAGGGGCVLFYCNEGRETRVARAIEDLGGKILPFNFDFRGLESWTVTAGREERRRQ